MSDLIEREEAIRAVGEAWGKAYRVIDALNSIPSAERKGEWKNHKDEHYCTNCGEVVIGDWYDEDDWYTYCPNCGARMKGAEDE